MGRGLVLGEIRADFEDIVSNFMAFAKNRGHAANYFRMLTRNLLTFSHSKYGNNSLEVVFLLGSIFLVSIAPLERMKNFFRHHKKWREEKKEKKLIGKFLSN